MRIACRSMDTNRHASTPASARGNAGRLAARATVQFILDTAEILSRAVNADTVTGLIFLGIISANTRHLRPGTPEAQSYAQTETIVPDSLRKGISVHALSLQVNLPYETTRRHVQKLINDGLCKRCADGVIVPASALASPFMMQVVDRNLANVHRFIDALERGGALEARTAAWPSDPV